MNVTLRLVKEEDLPLIQYYLSIEGVSSMTNAPEPYPTNGAREWFVRKNIVQRPITPSQS